MTKRRALSIREPWASLIVDGHKPIENRTWCTDYRGTVYIHAAKKWSKEDIHFVRNRHAIKIDPADFQLGGIIGRVELVDVIDHSTSVWFQGPYGFVLTQPVRVNFIPLRGTTFFFSF